MELLKIRAARCASIVAALWFVLGATCHAATARFNISFSDDVSADPLTGRLIVVVAREAQPEPRLAIRFLGPPMFGVDARDWRPNESLEVDASADAFPVESLRHLPPGAYHVQAMLIRYQQVRRADGHRIWVPIHRDRERFFDIPGSLYSEVRKVEIDAVRGFDVALRLAHVVPPREPRRNTEWIRHVRMQSKLLTEFWGTPIHLAASVLVPRGFDARPDARYPAVYLLSHGERPFRFNPDPASDTESARKAAAEGNLQTGYQFYRSWSADDYPRMAAISIFQSSPFAGEAYALDSANNGPFGAAITQELIPFLEQQFRLIPQPYARIVEGASTGGWEALALQVHYPDYFGGAWIFNPDPIDFTRYGLSDIYADENMFTVPVSEWIEAERPFRRSRAGQPLWSLRLLSRFEAVLGSKGRSGYQLAAWQAVHGPVGPDGYPMPLWDGKTGKIDRAVAEYMREHGYDLTEYTRRHWPVLGPKLIGKLNFFAGESDDFFLNLAVYRFQEMLQGLRNPRYAGRFEYGRPLQGHSWHQTDFSEMIREISEHVRRNAPAGENTSQWTY